MMTRDEAEAFLYGEARLIDDRRFDDWLDRFTADGVYLMPGPGSDDPSQGVALIFEDRTMLASRIRHRLTDRHAFAQSPPSETLHVVSNVAVEDAGDGEVTVHSAQVVYESRLGQQRSVAARCSHRLRRVDGNWRIAAKTVRLIGADQVLRNLSFLI